MAVYVDSSAVLSILFQEPSLERSKEIWKSSRVRISSVLLAAECKVSIRRIYSHHKKKLGPNWREKRLEELDRLLEEIHLKNLDRSTLERLDDEEALSGCRTLDALHLATALEFRRDLRGEISIFSYDVGFNQVAEELGFRIL
ncbi:PIN domain-containing protein [Leptospira langatensis]|uniref:PIN domain-containing protein n=1 Tax=Leptospira langatensis TaxID=2484983 RepID=A0A5F1ZP20_9LEPT|nr:PIN domain-containing protein [Leptospira langatensis]TGK05463.1 PIN domain-containing protein [Leptospira langatensis]TGL38599.1 PIN domain-containing protein [Leptospira langatensis]